MTADGGAAGARFGVLLGAGGGNAEDCDGAAAIGSIAFSVVVLATTTAEGLSVEAASNLLAGTGAFLALRQIRHIRWVRGLEHPHAVHDQIPLLRAMPG